MVTSSTMAAVSAVAFILAALIGLFVFVGYVSVRAWHQIKTRATSLPSAQAPAPQPYLFFLGVPSRSDTERLVFVVVDLCLGGFFIWVEGRTTGNYRYFGIFLAL